MASNGVRAKPAVLKPPSTAHARGVPVNLDRRTDAVVSKITGWREAGGGQLMSQSLASEAESLMGMWTTSAENRGRAGPAVERLLQAVLGEGENDSDGVDDASAAGSSSSPLMEASVHMFYCAVEAWVHYSPEDNEGTAIPATVASDSAERWLRALLERWKAGYAFTLSFSVDNKTQSNRINSAFALVVHALLKSGADDEVGRAQDLALSMRTLYDTPSEGTEDAVSSPRLELTPDTTAMNAMLHVLSRNDTDGSAKAAMLLLERMTTEASRFPELAPNAVSFGTVALHFARQGNVSGVEAVLSAMEALRDTGGGASASPSPDLFCFNALLKAHACSGASNAGDRAEAVLDRMTARGVEADTVSYSCVLACHARSASRGGDGAVAAPRAEKVLRFMIDEQSRGRGHIRTDTVAFTTVVDAWSKVGGVKAAERAEALVNEMEQLGETECEVTPSIIAYNALMRAWAKSGTNDAPQRVLKVLERAKAGGLDLDTSSYNAILLAYAKSDAEDSLERSNEILRTMETESSGTDQDATKMCTSETKHSVCRPDVNSYAAYLDCVRHKYSASGGTTDDLLREAESVVHSRMPAHGVPWNETVLRILMEVYAHSRRDDAPSEAIKLLGRMEDRLRDNDNDNYGVCLRPTTATYNVALSALSRSRRPGRHTEAWRVLQRMGQASSDSGPDAARPDVNTYNLVLNCCAFAPGDPADKRDSVQVAMDTLEQMQQQKPTMISVAQDTIATVSCDQYTYATLLKVFGTNLPKGEERSSLVEQAFRQCCAEGLVSKPVLIALQRAAPVDLLRALLQGEARQYKGHGRDGIVMEDLPKEWCRHVRR